MSSGDGMTWNLKEKRERRARKCYKCDWCGELIEKGETYYRSTNVVDGNIEHTRMHLECAGAVKRAEDDCDIDGEGFFELFAHKRGKTYKEEEAEEESDDA